jgi:riboflavin-specific deaminase-like protein
VFVFANLAISVDGKIATVRRGHLPIASAYDRRLMQSLRRRCDAVLTGAGTLRAYRKPNLARGARRQPINVVMSRTLAGLSPAWPFFTTGVRRVLLVAPRTPRARIARFERTCTVVRAAGARQAIAALKKLGVRRLLVEGGGDVMWAFVRDNLIDEYHLTLAPRLFGGSKAPTLVDGAGLGPRDVVNLKLVRARRRGDELYLVYRRTPQRGITP